MNDLAKAAISYVAIWLGIPLGILQIVFSFLKTARIVKWGWSKILIPAIIWFMMVGGTFFLFVVLPIVVRGMQASSARTVDSMRVEYRLACLNAGHNVAEDDVTVHRFKYLLDSLEEKVQEHENWKGKKGKREMIADVSYSSVQMLKEKYGKNVSLLEFMELMNKRILDNDKIPYTVHATLLVMTLGQ